MQLRRLLRTARDIVGVVVSGELTDLTVASKNMSSPARALSVVELNRALFTVGLISKHFDFADIVDETTRVCILLAVGVIFS